MDQTDSLESWLKQLLGVEKFKPGLDRLIPIFNDLKERFLAKGIKIITIGGTNGKGECSYSLEYLLRQTGLNTALWTSPHIKSATERFLFNGKNISENELIKTLKSNQHLIGTLSYYEFLFKAFCDLVLDQKKIDVVIFEVGLGGCLDTVNLFDADIAAITSIGLDHQEYLGNSLKGILKEKLGITRTGKTLLCCLERKFLNEFALQYCSENKIKFHNLLFDKSLALESEDYSFQNRALASALKHKFLNVPFNPMAMKYDLELLQHLRLRARMETFHLDNCIVTCNGAHNIDGMRKLRDKLLADKAFFDMIIFAPSARKDSEIKSLIKVLKSAKCLYNKLVITTFENHPRSLTQAKFREIESELEMVDWQKELETCKDKGNRVLLTGSYYFIGEFQKTFNL